MPHRIVFILIFVASTASALFKYKILLLQKVRDLLCLAYAVCFKRNRIMVAYAKDHIRFNAIAQNPPAGIIFVKISYGFRSKLLIKYLASKIDIIYDTPSNGLPLLINKPIVREFETDKHITDALNNKMVKKIFVLSEWVKTSSASLHDKIEMLYPSITPIPEIKRDLQNRRLTIAFCGSCAFRKGADIVFRAFENVEKKFGDAVSLSLIMASNYKKQEQWYPVPQEKIDSMKEIYRLSRHKNNVYFGPIHPHTLMNRIYRHADIFVMPSRYEAFGMSVLEAMNHSLPVITTDIMAFPERVHHGENGFMIQTKNLDPFGSEYLENAVKELENYLTVLIQDPSLRIKMGIASRRLMEKKFNIEYKKKRLKETFEDIMSENTA